MEQIRRFAISKRGQSSFFVKLLFIVASSVAFLLVYLYLTQFQTSTIQEKTSSQFRIETLNTLQKLVTDYGCLAYQPNRTFYKIVIDKSKLDGFVAKYADTEPDCAKALDFDYNIRVSQFGMNYTLYGFKETYQKCERICKWDYVWICYTVCYNVTVTRQNTNLTVKPRNWHFGVSSFSPGKAKQEEIQLALPIVIRYNETLSTNGIIYIYAVRGELESLTSTLEDLCEKAMSNSKKDITYAKDFHFSYPVSYDLAMSSICMLDSCKKFSCPYSLRIPIIQSEGDYSLNFIFNSTLRTITVGE